MFQLILQYFSIAVTITSVFGEVSTVNDVSSNIVDGANLYKCTCGKNEVLSDGECVLSSNVIPVWDYAKQKDFVVDISKFSSVTVNPITCPPGFSKLTLNISHFVIYTNGLLDNLLFTDQPPTQSYCIDHVSIDGGITLVAEVCEINPSIPICCPYGYSTNDYGECEVRDGLPFNPPLLGDFQWEEYNITEQTIECPEGEIFKTEILTYPHEFGASLVSYPLGSRLQWNSLYRNFPHYIHHDEYCLIIANLENSWQFLAKFCLPDPKLEDREICFNRTCIKKCCPLNYIYSRKESLCVRDTNHVIGYNFIDKEDNVAPDPDDLTLIFGFPYCQEFHLVSNNRFNSNTIQFYEDGTLALSQIESYSTDHYCVEGFSGVEEEDVNNTLLNSALICFRGLDNPCPWRWIIGNVLLSISCLFYILTLIVYLGIEDLRNKIVGKCLISEVSALLAAYAILIFLQNNNSSRIIYCSFPGTIEHIAILASFFWLNVLCFDMWNNIRQVKQTKPSSKRISKRFLIYCAYAWGSSLAIATIRVIVDSIPEDIGGEWLVRSHIGENVCFFSGQYSLAKWLYLYGPVLVLLLVNLAFFIHVAIVIVRTKKEAAKLMSNSESAKSGKNFNAKKEKALLYLKLFLVMGISWFLEIIMWVAVPEQDCMFWALDIVNMFQGVFIFIIFVCKKTIIAQVKEKFHLRGPPRREEYQLTDTDKTRDEIAGIVA